MNVVTTRIGKQVENSNENHKEVEESFGQKNVEIEENPPTPPEKQVVEEMEKEAPHVAHHLYKPPISFSKIFVEDKVGVSPKSLQKYWKRSTPSYH